MQISPKISRPVIRPFRARSLYACRRGALPIAAVACAALLGACGSSKSSSSSATATKGNVNTAQVALSIKESILAQRHLAATVVCPPTVAAEPGKTFECVATTRSTKKPFAAIKTPFVVTVKNSKGGVTYVGK
jgi:hypothetical protein